MKKIGKILCFLAVIYLLAANPVFSQTPPTLNDLRKNVGAFSESLMGALPFNSTMGLNWSDAYIGQFLDMPPHFGIGFSMGATFIQVGSMNKLMKMFGTELPVGDLPAGLPLPGYTVEGRIGGFILPFDAGFKIGYIPSDIPLLETFGVGLDYLLVGGDVRYAIIKDGIIPLRLSIGMGLNHINGGISKSIPTGEQRFTFGNPKGGDLTLIVPNPDLGLRWKTTNLEFKAQASFPLILITPYVGIGVGHAWSEAGYEVKSKIKVNNGYEDIPIDVEIIDIMKSLGVTGVNKNGFESMIKDNGFNARLYGGLSFNMAVIKLDFTAMYNFEDSFGFTIGTRFQL